MPSEIWTAVVTGGAAGIGQAIARKLASRGINVLIANVQEKEGDETVADIKSKLEVDSLFIRTDVGLDEDIEKMITAAVERWGRIDYAANATGINQGAQLS